MRLLVVIFLMFPLCANAHDKTLYPTTLDIYEDCKEAIKIGDDGDLKRFLRTSCAARIQGIESMLFAMTIGVLPTDPPPSPTSRDGAILGFLKDRIGNLCLFNHFHKSRFKDELPELHIAKEYVNFVENHKNDASFLQKMDEIKTMQMLFVGRTVEECKKRIEGGEIKP